MTGVLRPGRSGVAVVHMGATSGWEQRGPRFADFNSWFRQAIEEFIEHEC
jgi:hypothetical protein